MKYRAANEIIYLHLVPPLRSTYEEIEFAEFDDFCLR